MTTRTRRGKNEGSITKRRDGRWEARITVGYLNGKQQRQCLYGKTRAEVADKLAKAQREHQQGLPQVSERTTVGGFLDTWLVDVAKPTVAPTTYARYEQLVRLHIKPELGHIRLAQLTPQQVQALLNRKLKSGLAPATVRQIQAVLRVALNKALSWEQVSRNSAALANPPKVPKAEIKPLDIEEAKKFLKAAVGDRLEALYVLAIATGFREGELLGLQWDNVDLDTGEIRVSVALQRIDGKHQLVEPKTDSSHRAIVLPAFALTALSAHRLRQVEQRLAAGHKWQKSGFVFTTRRGTPLDSSNVGKYYKRVLKRAELPPRRFHDLRHTCATLLFSQGVPARTVMEILGHSQISLTMNTYTHVLEPQKQAAAQKMNELLQAEKQPLRQAVGVNSGVIEIDLVADTISLEAEPPVLAGVSSVRRVGLEPTTVGLRVRCSTS